MTQSPLQTALAYAELGLAVIPLCGPGCRHPRCKSPGKRPYDLLARRHMEGWQHRGVPSPEEIERWLKAPGAERANIGCLTGRVSGIVAVDVDGPAGEALLTRLAGTDLPATWTYRTGRENGGRRLVFRYPESGRIPSRLIEAGGGTVEILSDGRQMVLPPSVHPSGRVYAWLPGRDPWAFGPPAPAPRWLLELAEGGGEGHRRTPEEWARIIREGAEPGARHPTLTQLAGHLLGKRVDPAVTVELLQAWNEARCRPPKPREEVERIVRDLWMKDQAKPRPAADKPQGAAGRKAWNDIARLIDWGAFWADYTGQRVPPGIGRLATSCPFCGAAGGFELHLDTGAFRCGGCHIWGHGLDLARHLCRAPTHRALAILDHYTRKEVPA
ncbi:bifunctional DNA primase/polymerase [Thermaerobacter composti]|uniref:Bifunctional DNA primase/polymerase n=1 Tax=Thermaerobacter composti TaxID=554949 RepID=A0ABZ0QNI8_9FIRM|nr:bifunctional DNA primase/polymerase [Thermaerobacter composti]WPD17973.1 bifunctional DNA primase/polymerase [Thermaerobacter composti]